ncbi:hypothetical protein LTR86_002943 [Recurvomyces mirabilis]|nr:hypothetical protein LTR86_002943 [Recurvomyces mirabilis]
MPIRLLHTRDLTFKDCRGTRIPRYAILSHRWRDPEISYQDFMERQSNRGHRQVGFHQGHDKVKKFCEMASERGFDYVWIDTCCIDKKSSAELTEALNSMWEWYRRSDECYAFLWDLPNLQRTRGQPSTPEIDKALRASDWFTRAWTLQELLAPKKLYIVTREWQILGSRDGGLTPILSKITGIAPQYMTGHTDVHSASIATRMSWASRRTATEIEDTAYCLMGIFDVNMPLLYGEREKAFMRLQREIILKSDDESIFAWRDTGRTSGMLARWPTAFADSSHVVVLSVSPALRLHYHLSNKGLELQVPRNEIEPREIKPARDDFVYEAAPMFVNKAGSKTVHLACEAVSNERESSRRIIGIQLRSQGHAWHRVHCDKWEEVRQTPMRSETSKAKYYVTQPGM